MIKMMTGAACALMLLAAGAASAQIDDDDYTFTIANTSSMTIVTFHLVSQHDDSWSEDLIPDRVIAPGETVDMRFSPDEDECEYATAAVMDDGTEFAEVLDYCGISGVEVSDEEMTTF